MMNQTGAHEPTPEFRARLEWQIESALRRRSRFSSPVTGRWRGLKAAAVILFAVALGGAAGIASAQVPGLRARGLLLENATSELQIATMRLDIARADLEETRRRFDAGVITRAALTTAELEVRSLETAVRRAQLDIDEIEATGATPRNDLSAPLVDGHDYVTQRLQLEIEAVLPAVRKAESELQEAQRRVRMGVTTELPQFEAESQLMNANSQLELLQTRLRLREQFLEGEIDANQLTRELRQTELRTELERAQRELTVARDRVSFLTELHEQGAITELELRRAEVAMLERESELQRIQRELDMIAGLGEFTRAARRDTMPR